MATKWAIGREKRLQWRRHTARRRSRQARDLVRVRIGVRVRVRVRIGVRVRVT